jgi:hypothetical protein
MSCEREVDSLKRELHVSQTHAEAARTQAGKLAAELQAAVRAHQSENLAQQQNTWDEAAVLERAKMSAEAQVAL